MSQPITLEDIFQLFERQKEETERRAAEFERSLAASKAEADRRAAEFERSLAASKAEADRRAAESKAEADRRHAEIERLIATTNAAVNSLTSRWGRFVEELVRPAVVRLFRAKGIDLKHTFLRACDEARQMEIDILGVNSTDVVLVECKSRLSHGDVDDFLRKLPLFKTAFPEFAAYRIYGAVAGIEIDQGVDRRAYQKGLFVIKPSGDTVTIVNDENFQPKTW
jgi:hypothetical protein